ncbi:MAG: ABC transporter ATP-binding protein [Clostridiales bacterium]|nr:ABC transporter ATP-binding protein [Clostridiales bacterium]
MKVRKKQPFKKVQLKKGTAKRMLLYVLRNYYAYFIAVIFLIFVSCFVNVANSLFLQVLLDDYITPLIGTKNPNWIPLLKFIIYMSIVYVIGTFATFLYNRIMIRISQGTLKNIRNEMFLHMQKLPLRYFYTHEYGDIMSVYTNDTDTLREMIGQGLPQIFSSILTIIMVLIAMVKTNIYLTCLVLIITFGMVAIIKKVTKTGSEYFLKVQESIGKINGFMEEMLNAQKVVKSFSYENVVKEKFNTLNNTLCEDSIKANKYILLIFPMIGNISNIQYVLIAILGGILSINSNLGITLGSIASFLQLSKTIAGPIQQISLEINSIVLALAGAERIFDLLDEEIEDYTGHIDLVNVDISKDSTLTEVTYVTNTWAWKNVIDGSLKKVEGKVQFFDVGFEYKENTPILKNFGLYANPGQKVALIGATGAGKTTIANLINRFYDIQHGKILFDGINITDIKKCALRNSIGMVLQDTNLFTGTIMENIRYGNLSASDEDIYNASKLAHAHDFISKLPDRYNTKISNNGEDLSEGQRKLLAIAQAIVNNPPVMILDEATSSIDTRTEKLVQKGMDELMKGRTSFVIAHRLQTIQDADVILVIDHGEIIERGKHQDLINHRGIYYNLYMGAFS